MEMKSAVIVDAVRTPIGKRNGALRDWHPVDLLGEVFAALQRRSDLDPELVDDVITGCVMQVGEQSMNIARSAVLGGGWPATVPGTTVDRQCGSSQQALHFAAQGVMAGVYDVVVASGVEVMTRVPLGSSILEGRFGMPFGPRVGARYEIEGGLVPEGVSAELIAGEWGLTREALDGFSAESHARAHQATGEGRFDSEIIPVVASNGLLLDRDEGIRADATAASLGALKPSFVDDGLVTAGNSSQISDGASAVLVMSESRAVELGLRPRARFYGFGLAGDDPRLMLTAHIPATWRLLDRVGLEIDDIDLFEVNETFASVVLAWAKEVRPEMDRVNVNGGAIALGHPLGCSGTRLMVTLLNELERTGGRYGMQIMSESGGMANATIIERLG
jgi:acetyl-CoA acyltransferase